MPQLEFIIDGPLDTNILIEEGDFNGDGKTDLKFTVTALETGGKIGDLRGLFWDVSTAGLLAKTSVYAPGSPDITDSKFKSNAVVDLGGGANMQGSITSGGKGFDAGVEIGTQGIGKDDIQTTSFVLTAAGKDLTLAEISGQRFGVRYTSVGVEDGKRPDSLKIVGEAPEVNRPPVADADQFFVEYGDSALVDVLANDVDADGVIVPATLAFATPALGSAVNSLGQLLYTADPIVYDFVDSSANDPFVYTVEDEDGDASNPAIVTAKVIDPLRETAEDSDTTDKGQLISLSLSTEQRTYNTTSFVEVDIAVGDVGKDVNISFVIDGSGSISAADYAQQRLAVQNTINQLRIEYAGSQNAVRVQLVQFADGAQAADYDLYANELDNIAGGGTPISAQTGGFTNYFAGLDLAENFFTGKGDDENFLLFCSDGQPNRPVGDVGSYLTSVADLETLNVSRTAVGFGAATVATLDTIDNTGGSEVVANAAALGDVFANSALFAADLIEFSLTVNGTEVADETNLVDLSGGDYSLDNILLGLNNGPGDVNTIVATAGFDTDNNGTADVFRTATTTIDGTDGTGIIFV